MAEISGVTPPNITLPGGVGQARQLNYQDQALFEEFRSIIEYKLRSQFPIPVDFMIQPEKVRTQVVAGTIYYFYVPLPTGQFAVITITRPLPGQGFAAGDPSSFVNVKPETVMD